MNRFFKWAGLTLLSLLLILVLMLSWLVTTESGVRWALRQAPDTLSIKTVHGSLSKLTFSDLHLQLDGLDIKVSSGTLNWALRPLLSKTINIDTLHLNGVQITTHPKNAPALPTPYEPWQGLELPFNATLSSLQLNKLSVQSKRDATAAPVESLSIDTVSARLAINNNVLAIEQLHIMTNDNVARLNGDIDLSAQADAALNLTHSATWNVSEQTIDSTGTINGRWSAIHIEQSTNLTGAQSTLRVNVNDVLSHQIHWHGTLVTSAASFNLNATNNVKSPTHALELGKGEFSFNGAIKPAEGLSSLLSHIQGQASARHQQYSHWHLNTELSIANNALHISRFALDESLQTATASVKNQQNIEAKNNNLPSGKITINGTIDGVSHFLEHTTDNSAQANLNGQWSNLSWPLKKPSRQSGNIISDSNGFFTLRGQANDIQLMAHSDGKLYANPLNANIDVRVLPTRLEINALKFKSGETKVDIAGQLGDKLSLNWLIQSPDLAALSPELSGDFTSRGELRGTREKPHFDGIANSTRLAYNDLTIAGVQIKAKGALSARLDTIAVSANVASIQQQKSNLASNVDLALVGTGAKHTLNIKSTLFGQSDLSLMAQGGITNTGWSGRLDSLELADPDYDTWTLKQAVAITHDDAKLNTDLMCLTNQRQSACVTLNTNETTTHASGSISAVDLNNLNPLLSLYDATVSGVLNGDFDYQKPHTDGTATINATLDTTKTLVTFKQIQGEPQRLSIASVSARLTQQKSLSVDATLQLDNGDQATLDFNVAAALGETGFSSAPINGKVRANIDDLSALKAAIPLLNSLDGTLNSDIELSGHLDQPLIAMQAQLANANLSITDLGLNLTAINLKAHSSDKQKIELAGSLQSGQGQLNLDGILDLTKPNDPRVKLSVKGQSLELMKTPEIHVDGDVDLTVLASKQQLNLNGAVNLIEASLDFQLPENAILASEDVVLLGQEKSHKGMQTQMNLSLNLGDKTHIRAQGLDAFLVGRLQILQEPGGILKGKGQIDVKEGRFDAYNQKLNIDKGQLIFSGGSIDDPTLDMRAQKTVNNITAGVSVSGRANAPALRLYSTPSLTDQDILSVLIFDKPIGNLGSQDGLTLLKIANSLRGGGESQVSIMTQRIQDSLGLSNLALELDGDAPKISAGKQLSSKFYVGYGYGLLDAAQTIVLRYKISKAWSIQGDLGADSGADLRYQIER